MRVLSMHAPYRCLRRGACCTAAWPIPVEADRLAALQAALASRALRPAVFVPPDEAITTPADAPEDAPGLLAIRSHACVFYDAYGTRGCRIHEALGHDALPLACRQFPRVTVIDPGGASVTLSAYCPTVAGLLENDGPICICTDVDPWPALDEHVGLDATASLPPALTPSMLMDWDAWWVLEAQAVDWLANRAPDRRAGLTGLYAVVERLRDWTPAAAPLPDRILDTFAALPRATSGLVFQEDTSRLTGDIVMSLTAGVAAGLPRPSHAPIDERVACRFLAAHAFASWTAHLGHELLAWVRSIACASALLDMGYDVRQADLILRHLVDPAALALRLSDASGPRRRRPTPSS